MSRNFLVIDPEERPEVLRGLASPARVRILRLLHNRGGVNVNDIAEALGLPQSTVSSNLQILESAGLIRTESAKGAQGQPEALLLRLRRSAGDVPRRSRSRQRQRDRGRDADRALHEL